ncbi:FAD-binding oxidoreductase [Rhabdothermincola sediminis]|uniref:FAD-binding oxidoreductase n=1 Tax=Rhabdothermincola sediminis TaxID=2751370 RepID=UPI001AA0300B|nr:FAD-binding oxidoreductase [Rhabdothermincola sediminis]
MAPHGLDAALDRVAGIVGSQHVVVDPDVTRPYRVDWTGRFHGTTPAVIRPGNVEELAEVVRVCADARVAIVPQGGNTGLVGGGVPLEGELVLSTRRLSALGEVDELAGQVTAGAGVTISTLHERARAAGLEYPVDLAARDSATVGGTIATNAGGLHVIRWGGTRAQLRGIEAVLADGSVVRHLAGLPKDNTGLDLAGLLCGSEGTLGVVTAARLALVPHLPERVVALAGFEDLRAAVAAVARVRRGLSCLDAAEVFFAEGLSLVCEVEGLREPFRRSWPVYVLLEASDHEDPTERMSWVLAAAGVTGDVAVGTDARTRAELWAYRERHTSAINTLGPPHKLDLSLPLPMLPDFVARLPGVVARHAPGARTWLFGHIGDGNLHVNITGTAPDDEEVDGIIFRMVASCGGSISAEHGIGTAKKRWLHLNRSAAEVRAFRSIKRALDPRGVLNPNVLLPPD